MTRIKRTVFSDSIVAAFMFLLFLSGPNLAYSQEPASSPSQESEELKALKERNAILEQQTKAAQFERDMAEARKKEAEAKYPKASTTPLEGKTTISDGAVIETQMISYLSMAYAANRLISQLKGASVTDETGHPHTINIRNMAIYNERDINLLMGYTVALNQLKLIQLQYENLLAKPKGTSAGFALSPSIASSFLGSFVDLTALLRTNVDIKGQTFDMDEATLVSEVFRGARAKDGLRYSGTQLVSLYYPAAFPLNIDVNEGSIILGKLQDIFLIRTKVTGLIGALEDNKKKTDELEAKIKKLKSTLEEIAARKKGAETDLKILRRVYGHRPPLEVWERIRKLEAQLADFAEAETETNGALGKANTNLQLLKSDAAGLYSRLAANLKDPAQLEDTLAILKGLNEQFSKFVEALVKVNDTTGMNSLTGYIRAEKLTKTLVGPDSYWLQLKVVKAGGNNRIKTNLLVDVFRGGNRVSHSGGAIVQYNLFDTNGKSISSDTFTEYTGYINANKVGRLPNPANVADLPKR